MKILKIFGLVVGIHVVAFMFVFAIPGCRSTTRHSPPPSASVQAERAPSRPETAYPQNDATSLGAQTPSSPLVEPALNPANSSPAPVVNFGMNSPSSSGQRSNPTRPGASAATNLQTAPTSMPEATTASTYVVVTGDSLSKIGKKHHLSAKEIAAANNLRVDAPIRLGQKLMIPGKATPMSTAVSQPSAPANETLTYKVRGGDSLALIAKRAGTTSATIKSLNRMKTDTVRTGQDLILPLGTAASNLVASGAEPAAAPSSFRDSDGTVHHIVKPGENLGIIARHYGVKSSDLAVANNIADPLKVRAGQDLVIPAGKSTGGTRNATLPQAELRAPTVESTPATPSNPISSASDFNPIGPSTPPISAPTPPTIEVQETNPIDAPQP